MDKAVVVISDCWKCPYSEEMVVIRCDYTGEECPEKGLPDWCPLPEMPERIETHGLYGSETFFGQARGWNACLDAIEDGGNNVKNGREDNG